MYYFLYACLKNGTYYGNDCSGRRPHGFRSLSQRVFIRSLSNLVNMLVCIMSRPGFITSQISQALLNNGPWIVQNCPILGFPLSKSKSFCPVLVKHGENVGGHNILNKFFNQPNTPRHSWIMALELFKIRVYALEVRVFIWSLSNLMNILVGIISQPSSITCQIPPRHSWIMALELSKNWISGNCLPSPISSSKNVVITIEFTTNTTGLFCVSLALLLYNVVYSI